MVVWTGKGCLGVSARSLQQAQEATQGVVVVGVSVACSALAEGAAVGAAWVVAGGW